MAKLISKTYGDALFDIGIENGNMDELFDEAYAVIDIVRDNEELTRFLKHPKIDKEEKTKVIENIFKNRVTKDMVGFLILLVRKDRQSEVTDILEYFITRVLEYKKIGIAYVSSAVELSDKQREAVLNKLLTTTSYKEFQMHYSIDESLIGGMVIRIGDRVVDSSVKTKLDQMSKDLFKIQLA